MSAPTVSTNQIMTPSTEDVYGCWLDGHTYNQYTPNEYFFFCTNFTDYSNYPLASFSMSVSEPVCAETFQYGARLVMPEKWQSDSLKFTFITKLRRIYDGRQIQFVDPDTEDVSIVDCTHEDQYFAITIEKAGDVWTLSHNGVKGGAVDISSAVPQHKVITQDGEGYENTGNTFYYDVAIDINGDTFDLYINDVKIKTTSVGESIHLSGYDVGFLLTPKGYAYGDENYDEYNSNKLNFGITGIYVMMCESDILDPVDIYSQPPAPTPTPTPSVPAPTPTPSSTPLNTSKYITLTANKSIVDTDIVLFYEYFNFEPNTVVFIECMINGVSFLRKNETINPYGRAVIPFKIPAENIGQLASIKGVDWYTDINSNTIKIEDNVVVQTPIPVPNKNYPKFIVQLTKTVDGSLTYEFSLPNHNINRDGPFTVSSISFTSPGYHQIKADDPRDYTLTIPYNASHFKKGINAFLMYLYKYTVETNHVIVGESEISVIEIP